MSFTKQKNESDVVARFWRSLEERAAPQDDAHRRQNDEQSVPVPADGRELWVRGTPASPADSFASPGRDADDDGVGRRQFLQLMGTSIAIPSLAACTRQPPEKIIPYVRAPEEIVPGKPLFYATASVAGGLATGTLVEAHMGRPTKVEGNPEHPSSLGGSDIFGQAEILELYDPDRSQTVMHGGAISSWGDVVGALQAAVLSQKSRGGVGLRILTGDTSSPTFIRQMRELLAVMPEARWHIHEPLGPSASYAATRAVFGEPMDVLPNLLRAAVVLSLDADFLGAAEGHPGLVRDFARCRARGEPRPPPGPDAKWHHVGVREMLRLYVVEAQLSLTGANADHRAPVKPSEVEHVARIIAAKLIPDQAETLSAGAQLPTSLSDATIDEVVADLKRVWPRGVVLAGRHQPAVVHMLAARMNAELQSTGVRYLAPSLASGSEPVGTLRELVSDLDAGKVELLVISGCNPVYAAPGDVDVGAALQKAAMRVHHGLHFDETAALCHWHVPAAHTLEAWSDARSHDGTPSVVQPLIEPLYGGKSSHQLVAALGDRPDQSGYDIVRATWRAALGATDFESAWSVLLHDGVLAGSGGFPTGRAPTLRMTPKNEPGAIAWGAAGKIESGLELAVRPDPTIHDGRFSNNAWLQELPKPLTKLTWDNAAILAPATAAELGVESEDVVELEAGGRTVRAPVYVMPGTAPGVVVVHLGYGRERMGHVANGVGFSAYALTHQAGPWHGAVELKRTWQRYPLSSAQTHHSMEGRDLIRSAPAVAYRADPEMWRRREHKRLSLYPRHDYPGYAWGLSIDLSSCIGCSACVIACQSENNIPVVGKDQVAMGREMHWLRIDRYFEGPPDNPRVLFQPVPCMHCENAPCEAVCPVAATAHHEEGLNDMVYNRCVGTKYCSNNCPYKVRRYNFFGYSHEQIAPMDPNRPSVQMSRNPDVTVRWYGVMEKCSYCVQRINYARIAAKKEDRRIADGDVMTACQAACPARAISFGDINDAQSHVAKKKADPRNYTILAELNTEPRTSYLAKLTNENPALTAPGDGSQGH